MELVQIDDVIPKPYQNQLESEASALGWYFHRESARPGLAFARTFSGFYHMAFDISQPSPVASGINALLVPLLFVASEKAGIKFTQLIRVRLGMFPQTTIDTVVFDETFEDLTVEQSVRHANEGRFTERARIAPQKGRMAFFDGKHYHASMHPQRHADRIVVTFNFR